MLNLPKTWSGSITAALPTVFVGVVLAGVGYWGTTNGWQAGKFAGEFPRLARWLNLGNASAAEIDEKKPEQPTAKKADGPPDWCEKHGSADSLCTVCHPELATRPAASAPADEVAIEPAHDPKQCRTHLEVIKFPSEDAVRLAGVRTAPAALRPMTEVVTAYGVIEYDEFQTAKVAPRAHGVVWAVFKRRGDAVKAGEVLALVDAPEVGKAKAEYLQAAVQLDTRVRARAPLQTERVSERLIQEAEAAVREARARLFTAQQALLSLGLPLRGDEAGLADEKLRERLVHLGIPDDIAKALPTNTDTANLLPLTSAVAGTVVDGVAVQGQTVAARETVFTVSDLSSVHVLLDFRPEDAPRLAVGLPVEFRPDGADGLPAAGTLHWLSPSVDEKTRMVHAHAEVPNPAGRLRANAFGTATVTVRRHACALTVPAEAVQWEGCSHVVFVADSATAFRPRKVRLGLRQNGAVEILVGLKKGDVVATAGSHGLKSYLFRDRIGATDD